MGGCLTAEKPMERSNSRYGASQRQSEASQVEEYIYFPQEHNFKKKSLTSKPEELSRKDTDSLGSPMEIKSKRTMPGCFGSRQNESVRESQKLPNEIVTYIRGSKVLFESMKREKEKQAEMQKKEATQYLVKKSLVRESLLESPKASLLSQNHDQEQSEVLEIITSYGRSSVYQSKLQRELLSSSEFKQKLARVKFLERQPAEEFTFVCQLGKGNGCKVYKACHSNNPSNIFAVRIIAAQDQKFINKIREEIAVMNLCQSDNIIKHYFTYCYQQTLFMFIEYMDRASLNQFIKRYGKGIDERVIAYIIREILKGLRSIHRRRQVHRDLKSDNILINRNGDIKIGDFGYALQLTKQKSCSQEIAGTPAWMAPELIKKEDYTEKVDIWSLGIILVELCQGEPRYLNMKPLMAMIMIATRPPETVSGRSVQLQAFLGRCLKKNPEERASAWQLLTDPFLTKIGSGIAQKAKYLQMLDSNQHKYI